MLPTKLNESSGNRTHALFTITVTVRLVYHRVRLYTCVQHDFKGTQSRAKNEYSLTFKREQKASETDGRSAISAILFEYELLPISPTAPNCHVYNCTGRKETARNTDVKTERTEKEEN